MFVAAFFFALALSRAEYQAEIARVIDGDTVAVLVRVWPAVTIEARIRILGIDTPELRGKCQSERERARAAKEFVQALIPAGSTVTLRNVKADKYAGRHDAEIWTAKNQSVGQLLIGEGLARPYHGEARQGWCSP